MSGHHYPKLVKGHGKERERSLSYCHGQNRLCLGKLVSFITSQIREIKPSLENLFPPTSIFFPGLTSLLNFPPPSHEQGSGTANCHYGQFIPLCHSFLLTGRIPHTYPAPLWGHSHRRQPSMNFSKSFLQAVAFHKLLPVWVLSMGSSPSGTKHSSAGPHRVTTPASKLAQVLAPLSTH